MAALIGNIDDVQYVNAALDEVQLETSDLW